MHEAHTPGPWAVENIGPSWVITNRVTGRRKVVGPAAGKRTNYFVRALQLASERNAALPPVAGTPAAQSEDRAPYNVLPSPELGEDATIEAALAILERRVRRDADLMDSPRTVRDFLAVRHAGLDREVFEVIYLTAQNKLIEVERLFSGTLTQTAVYPREVVKSALAHNAAGVILSHNHPSGESEPSNADRMLTATLKTALAQVDVQVLDHVITAGGQSMSFAERGLL